MRRFALYAAFGWIAVAGCQTPERAALKPLPPDAPPLAYPEMVTRTHDQIDAAQKFFFRDDWEEVIEASKAIKDSADRLGKMKLDDLPEKNRAERDTLVKQLTEAADALAAAAAAKDVNKSTDAMTALQKTIRGLRPRP